MAPPGGPSCHDRATPASAAAPEKSGARREKGHVRGRGRRRAPSPVVPSPHSAHDAHRTQAPHPPALEKACACRFYRVLGGRSVTNIARVTYELGRALLLSDAVSPEALAEALFTATTERVSLVRALLATRAIEPHRLE